MENLPPCFPEALLPIRPVKTNHTGEHGISSSVVSVKYEVQSIYYFVIYHTSVRLIFHYTDLT